MRRLQTLRSAHRRVGSVGHERSEVSALSTDSLYGKKGKNVSASKHAGGRVTAGKPRRRAELAIGATVSALVIGGFGAAASSAVKTSAAKHSPTKSAVDIVSFVPFSGADASYGDLALSGCYPAMYAINAAGGVMGHPINCTNSDTRGDPQDAVPAANALLAHSGSVAAVFGPSSDEVLSTESLFEQAKVPTFLMSGDTQYDKNTNPYMWRLVPPDADEGFAMAAWARKLGYTRAAAVFTTGSQAQADGPASQSGFKNLGGKIVADVSLTPGQPSYSTEAAQVANAHPQVIFYDGDAQTSATFFAELQQQGAIPPTFVVETEEEPAWISAVSGAIGASTLKKFTAFEAATPSTTAPGWKGFNQAIHASPKKVPNISQYLNDPFTLSYYDAGIILGLAMLEAHSTKPTKFNSYIMGITSAGAGKTVVHTFAEGKAALAAGKKIYYVGALGAIELDRHHNIAAAFNALTEGKNPQLKGQVPTKLMAKAAG